MAPRQRIAAHHTQPGSLGCHTTFSCQEALPTPRTPRDSLLCSHKVACESLQARGDYRPPRPSPPRKPGGGSRPKEACGPLVTPLAISHWPLINSLICVNYNKYVAQFPYA